MIARLYLLRQSQNLYFIYFENRLIVHLFQIKSFKLNMYEFENENDLINHTKSTRSLDSSQRENKNTIAKKKRLKCDKCGKIFIDLSNFLFSRQELSIVPKTAIMIFVALKLTWH